MKAPTAFWDSSPAALVAELHETLRRELPGRRFASLVVGELAPAGSLELVNAGH